MTETETESNAAALDLLPWRAPDGIALTPNSLSVTDPEMTVERVAEVLDRIRGMRDAGSWWTGDLIRFSEARHGEKYAQAVDATGLSIGRLMIIVSVCERVAPERRRAELSFSHHETVAALEPAAQSEWLEVAVRSGWSKEQLREALREAEQLAARPPRQPSSSSAGAAGGGELGPGETIDAARNLSVVRETLDLVSAALDAGEGDAGEIVEQLAARLPEALRALEDASEPVRKASGEKKVIESARTVVKDATLSDGFYMVTAGVFEQFKMAVESQTA